jgi:D-alanyl-D-alanine carboxypeptidase
VRRSLAGLLVGASAMGGTMTGALFMARVQDSGARPREPAAPTTVATPPIPTLAPPEDGQPDILLAWTVDALDPGLAAAVTGDPAVRHASIVEGGLVDLVSSHDAEGTVVDSLADGWAIPLDVVAVDPAEHSPFVAPADRPALAELGPGEALLGETSATLRRLGPGGVLDLVGGVSVVVIAVVDDASIGGAEAAVDQSTAEALGASRERFLLAAYDGDRATLEAHWRRRLTVAADARFRAPGETPYLRDGDAVLPPAQIKAHFGEFSYRHAGDGDEFEQDVAWQATYLVNTDLPLIGPVRCHRDVVDALRGALNEVRRAGLASLIDPQGFQGCWNPRFTRSGIAVSRHAWGVAVDLNYDQNRTGFASVQDPRLLEIFARWGFTDGSGWLVPDAGHFEYVAPPAG